jgi:predicted HD phosphohydrolase
VSAPRLAPSRRVPASSIDEVIAAVESSAAFDMTVDPSAHHDLLDHGLQTAAVLLAEHPDDVQLQIAGLLHDIGHVLPPFDDVVHGMVAAEFIQPVLGSRVADLVRLHVPAKRYLASADPTYRDTLNWGSTTSLEHQGGDMNATEQAEFERESLFLDALALRRADEAAKVAGLEVPDLDSWTGTLRAVADSIGVQQRSSRPAGLCSPHHRIPDRRAPHP